MWSLEMSKPLWVYVYWSESSDFKEKELLPFKEFERKALSAAKAVGIGNGYDKTKIKVLFDDGEYFECRLDLCPQEDTGFRSYCDSQLRWIGSDRFMKTYGQDDGIVQDYLKMRDYILAIEWGE
jgi:hypothetical protein